MKFVRYLLLFLFIAISCNTNPFTEKKTLAIVPNSTLIPMSFKQYDQVLDKESLEKGTEDAKIIQRIGDRIANAAEKWLAEKGYEDYTKDYEWEFSLIKKDMINAWAMPGGKVAFYTGILPVAKNDNGIATIMGHEVAHALANHGQQRMSAASIQQAVGVVGMAAIGNDNKEEQEIFNVAYGLGSQLGVMLPFSRKHETEADKIGLTIMAIAGYDPSHAYKLWQRMSEASGGKAPPEFLSTHPSNETRIKNLKEWSSKAKQKARELGVSSFE
jgi:predicted Zn-dependent protease